MADDDEQYELKTVRAIRGAEALTTTSWQKQGWEFVSLDKGTLRTEITFRRPKRRTPWRPMATAAAAVTLVITLAITTGLFEDDDTATVAEFAASPSATVPAEQMSTPSASSPTEQPSVKATVAPSEGANLSVEMNEDLAEILGLQRQLQRNDR